MGQLACLVLAFPAAAAEFRPPAGCTLTMTVQQRSCTVAQHYSCSADAAGDQWVAYFTRDGLVYQSRIDAETRWMESTDTVSGITDRLEPDAADHASLRTLMASGADTLAAELDSVLGTAWDEALEAYRDGGVGAEVSWLSRGVG